MARFDQRTIEEVASANDIVEVISSYVNLKNDGKNYSALCPFHREKTPSFKVFPDSQRFKCFGCGEGGNVFMFVSKIEKLTFPEAVELLARKAGSKLAVDGESEKTQSGRDLCHHLNKIAHEYFTQSLYKPEGKIARDYLSSRGLGEPAIKGFGLGYSPDNWNGLIDFARNKGVSERDLVDTGLAIRNEKGRVYDRFRNRVMFTIFDVQGKIAGFGARTLGDEHPKYLNSPDTPVFSKSNLLFGLNKARDTISKHGRAIMMEGYTDVIAAHEAGFPAAVATLGTAMTASHLRLLKRYARETVLVYDGDEAGVKAAERALPIFIAEDVEGRVVVLPDGNDPFDFIRRKGAQEFGRLLESAMPLFRFFLNFLKDKHDMTNPQQRYAAAERLSALVSQITDPLKREIWIADSAAFLGVRPEIFRKTVGSKAATSNSRDKLKGIEQTSPRPVEKLGSDEWRIIGALLAWPQLQNDFAQRLAEFKCASDRAQEILKKILAFPNSSDELHSLYWKTVEDETEFSLAEKAVHSAPPSLQLAYAVVESALANFDIAVLRERIEAVKQQLAEAEQEGDKWAAEYFEAQILELLAQIRAKKQVADPANLSMNNKSITGRKTDFKSLLKKKGKGHEN